jgi:sulfate/thiosulfate transport system ATP-binding protein
VMHLGRIEQVGTPDTIYNEPATPFVAGFVGAANVIQGQVVNGQVQFGDHFLPGADHLDHGADVHAYVRPHDVGVAMQANGSQACPAVVERVANLGWVSKLRLRLPDGQGVVAEVRNEEMDGVVPGATVYLDLRNARVFESEELEAAQSAEPDQLAAVGGP